jgi:hypothetical protein
MSLRARRDPEDSDLQGNFYSTPSRGKQKPDLTAKHLPMAD